jgi:hypothetical protein
MNTLLIRWSTIALVLGLSTAVLSGCVVSGDGYGYDNSARIGIGLGYYEPYGAYYGGWGPGYRVGPTRGNNLRPDRGSRPNPRAFRPAPAIRPMPSIPARRR